MSESKSRERVLTLFGGDSVKPAPIFSGMGNVTVHGIQPHGWRFADIHIDAEKMAAAAASNYELFGFEAAVVPFDMGVEAEALGCEINFYAKSSQDILYPTISRKLGDHVDGLKVEIPEGLAERGRVPLVAQAIRQLKQKVGDDVVVGSWVLGPFTLAGQIVELDDLLKASFKKPEQVGELLSTLSEFLIQLIQVYLDAGADYITVREMGGTSDVLSPRMFKSLILPHLQHLFEAIPVPTALHICGDTNAIVELMAETGAQAISVDQKNNIAETVDKVGDRVLVFGNLDPYNVLVSGSPDDIRTSVSEILGAGVDALWPGCDIWPSVPFENMQAMMESVRATN